MSSLFLLPEFCSQLGNLVVKTLVDKGKLIMRDVNPLQEHDFMFQFLDVLFEFVSLLIFGGVGFGDLMEGGGHAFGRVGALSHFDVILDLVDGGSGVGDDTSMCDIGTWGFHDRLNDLSILGLHFLSIDSLFGI